MTNKIRVQIDKRAQDALNDFVFTIVELMQEAHQKTTSFGDRELTDEENMMMRDLTLSIHTLVRFTEEGKKMMLSGSINDNLTKLLEHAFKVSKSVSESNLIREPHVELDKDDN